MSWKLNYLFYISELELYLTEKCTDAFFPIFIGLWPKIRFTIEYSYIQLLLFCREQVPGAEENTQLAFLSSGDTPAKQGVWSHKGLGRIIV